MVGTRGRGLQVLNGIGNQWIEQFGRGRVTRPHISREVRWGETYQRMNVTKLSSARARVPRFVLYHSYARIQALISCLNYISGVVLHDVDSLRALPKKPDEARSGPGSVGRDFPCECIEYHSQLRSTAPLPFLSWPPSLDFAPVFPSKRQGVSL